MSLLRSSWSCVFLFSAMLLSQKAKQEGRSRLPLAWLGRMECPPARGMEYA
jgi:hypothetical protein